ncbi:MAG: DUF721 domain-containing protein [Rickettsiella sp.]|nr:DUF721 domain-containing protein [Rickettsiella sp.]
MDELLTSKTIDSILQQDPQSILGFIQKKVILLKKINQLWQAEIPLEICQHSRVANFRENCLVIEIDSAAWATRLRYLIPDLTKKLAKNPLLNSLKQIEWYIQPNFHPSSAKSTNLSLSLSDRNAHLLRNTAMNIKGKPLQDALVRLSTKE